jgi:Cytochrome P450
MDTHTSNSFSLLHLLKIYTLPILVGLIIAHLLRNRFKAVLRDIPGPPLAAYTRLWRLYDVWKGDAHHTAIELHRKYGPLVRIGPNHVSVADPNEISNIYGLKTGFTKTGFYPIQCISWQKKPQMNLFSTRDEAYHREQKKPIANAYSLTSLLAKEDAVDSCTALFMQRLGEFADRNESVDLGTWLQYYAFDVVGELTFALKLGFLEQGKDVDGMMEAIVGMLVSQIPFRHVQKTTITQLFPGLRIPDRPNPRSASLPSRQSALPNYSPCNGVLEPGPGLHVKSRQRRDWQKCQPQT